MIVAIIGAVLAFFFGHRAGQAAANTAAQASANETARRIAEAESHATVSRADLSRGLRRGRF